MLSEDQKLALELQQRLNQIEKAKEEKKKEITKLEKTADQMGKLTRLEVLSQIEQCYQDRIQNPSNYWVLMTRKQKVESVGGLTLCVGIMCFGLWIAGFAYQTFLSDLASKVKAVQDNIHIRIEVTQPKN